MTETDVRPEQQQMYVQKSDENHPRLLDLTNKVGLRFFPSKIRTLVGYFIFFKIII